MGSWKRSLLDLVSWLEGNGDLESANYGISTDFDNSTETDFPQGFVAYGDGANTANLATYSFQVLFVDVCHQPADKEEKLEVLDRMSEVKNQCFKAYYEGSLFGKDFRVSNSASPMIYEDRKNMVYGWVMNIDITTPTDLNNCG